MRRPSNEQPKPEVVPHLRAVSSRWNKAKKENQVVEDELISVKETAGFEEKFNEQMFAADMAREFLGLQQHAADRVGKLRRRPSLKASKNSPLKCGLHTRAGRFSFLVMIRLARIDSARPVQLL